VSAIVVVTAKVAVNELITMTNNALSGCGDWARAPRTSGAHRREEHELGAVQIGRHRSRAPGPLTYITRHDAARRRQTTSPLLWVAQRMSHP